MRKKPVIMITLLIGGQNGGPYVSHMRIMNSILKDKFQFVPLMVPRARMLLNPFGFLKFCRVIKKTNPDVVHMSGLQLDGFLVMIACKVAGVRKTVLAIHGSSNEAAFIKNWHRKIMKLLEKITLEQATICYGVSDYVSSWDIVKCNSKSKIRTIYNLPHSIIIFPQEISLRKEFGLSKEDVLIVSTGRITKEKGFDILLSMIKTGNWSKTEKFIIVGEGDYLETMKKEVIENQLEVKVLFLGFREDIGGILSECDIFIICSLHETLCNSIIEAGQQSLPVIAPNVGGIPEIIINGFNGFLVSSNNPTDYVDALEKLVSSSELRKIMGNNAKKIIDHKFSAELILREFEQMYEEIIDDKK